MTKLFFLIAIFIITSCTIFKINKHSNSGSHITEINDGEGEVYFDIKYDSISLIELSEKLSQINKKDTCFIYLYLSAYTNTSIINDSISYSCQNDNLISDKILLSFFQNLNPTMQGDIRLTFEPYEFILPFSFSTGVKEMENRNESFRVGKRKKW